ncbi:hypothetical protein [Paenibacillus graminis]|nr:hypothetical protein [Paenibacillus graminis]MEC0172075.1 hypothetical protein [Paenibacillus graminis]
MNLSMYRIERMIGEMTNSQVSFMRGLHPDWMAHLLNAFMVPELESAAFQ